MSKVIVWLVCCWCLLSISSCASLISDKADPLLITHVEISEPDRIRFSGKGAGAGMMLSSSMGPMGIAIGVAIDEGISKDIQAAAQAGGLNIRELTKEAFLAASEAVDFAALSKGNEASKGIEPSKEKEPTVIDIQVERYGFIVVPGGEDLLSSELILTIHQNNRTTTIHFPDDFESESANLVSLDVIKTDAAVIQETLKDALTKLAQHYFAFLELNK